MGKVFLVGVRYTNSAILTLMSLRYKRSEDSKPFRFQDDTDGLLLKFIGEHRYTTAGILQYLIQRSYRKTALRIEKLFDNEYIERIPMTGKTITQGGPRPSVLFITKKGERRVHELYPDREDITMPPRQPATSTELRHNVGKSFVHALFQLYCEARPNFRIRTWRHESRDFLERVLYYNTKDPELELEPEQPTVKPDGFVIVDQ